MDPVVSIADVRRRCAFPPKTNRRGISRHHPASPYSGANYLLPNALDAPWHRYPRGRNCSRGGVLFIPFLRAVWAC